MADSSLPGIFTKAYWSNLYNYFFTALAMDKADKAQSASNGIPVPVPNGNIKNWVKNFGLGIVIIGLLVVGLWKFIGDKPYKLSKKPRDHHGYNKYGKRY
ncbi:MAG: hypothetical protein ABR927_17995 [Bacteroidales bacterium]|jgi:hypothetical protein